VCTNFYSSQSKDTTLDRGEGVERILVALGVSLKVGLLIKDTRFGHRLTPGLPGDSSQHLYAIS
jgi:hypothetical protein